MACAVVKPVTVLLKAILGGTDQKSPGNRLEQCLSL